MSKQLRFALTFLVPFLTASLAQASRVLADEGGVGAGLRHVGLTWEGVLSTIVYGAIGMAFAFLGYKLYDVVTPFSLTKELEEDQNVSVGIVVGAVILGTSIIMAAAIMS